jgi:hypothetical protein
MRDYVLVLSNIKVEPEVQTKLSQERITITVSTVNIVTTCIL